MNISLTSYEYLKDPEFLQMFSFKITNQIATIQLGINGYNRLVDEITHFHYHVATLEESQIKPYYDNLMWREEKDRRELKEDLEKLKKC